MINAYTLSTNDIEFLKSYFRSELLPVSQTVKELASSGCAIHYNDVCCVTLYLLLRRISISVGAVSERLLNMVIEVLGLR